MRQQTDSLRGTVAFITGASSGIGAALAVEFARRGAEVILTARRTPRMAEVVAEVEAHGVRALAVACDVTAADDLARAVEQGLSAFGRVDWVVANAGFGVTGECADLELEDYRRQFETNVYGVLRTIHASWEALVASRGCIAIIGSVAGEISFPWTSPYSMSKAAVHRLADSLSYESAEKGIGVTLVVPGYVESEIRQVDGDGVFDPERTDPVPRRMQMPADVAARKIIDAMVRRRRHLVLTGHGKLVLILQRFLPWLVPVLVRRFTKRHRARASSHSSGQGAAPTGEP